MEGRENGKTEGGKNYVIIQSNIFVRIGAYDNFFFCKTGGERENVSRMRKT